MFDQLPVLVGCFAQALLPKYSAGGGYPFLNCEGLIYFLEVCAHIPKGRSKGQMKKLVSRKLLYEENAVLLFFRGGHGLDGVVLQCMRSGFSVEGRE